MLKITVFHLLCVVAVALPPKRVVINVFTETPGRTHTRAGSFPARYYARLARAMATCEFILCVYLSIQALSIGGCGVLMVRLPVRADKFPVPPHQRHGEVTKAQQPWPFAG